MLVMKPCLGSSKSSSLRSHEALLLRSFRKNWKNFRYRKNVAPRLPLVEAEVLLRAAAQGVLRIRETLSQKWADDTDSSRIEGRRQQQQEEEPPLAGLSSHFLQKYLVIPAEVDPREFVRDLIHSSLKKQEEVYIHPSLTEEKVDEILQGGVLESVLPSPSSLSATISVQLDKAQGILRCLHLPDGGRATSKELSVWNNLTALANALLKNMESLKEERELCVERPEKKENAPETRPTTESQSAILENSSKDKEPSYEPLETVLTKLSAASPEVPEGDMPHGEIQEVEVEEEEEERRDDQQPLILISSPRGTISRTHGSENEVKGKDEEVVELLKGGENDAHGMNQESQKHSRTESQEKALQQVLEIEKTLKEKEKPLQELRSSVSSLTKDPPQGSSSMSGAALSLSSSVLSTLLKQSNSLSEDFLEGLLKLDSLEGLKDEDRKLRRETVKEIQEMLNDLDMVQTRLAELKKAVVPLPPHHSSLQVPRASTSSCSTPSKKKKSTGSPSPSSSSPFPSEKQWRALGLSLPLEARQLRDKYVLTASLPAFREDLFKMEIEGNERRNLLTVEGAIVPTRKEEEDMRKSLLRYAPQFMQFSSTKEALLSLGQGRFGSFRDRMELPSDVDLDRIASSYKDGVLTISLPRKERSRLLPASRGSLHASPRELRSSPRRGPRHAPPSLFSTIPSLFDEDEFWW